MEHDFVSPLRFDDDIILISSSPEELKNMLNELHQVT